MNNGRYDRVINFITEGKKLIERFDVDEEQCTTDVIEFLNELNKEGLIKVVNEKS